MPPSVLDILDRIDQAGSTLSLRRVWVRSVDHLALEYADVGGRPIAAQWHRDQRILAALRDGVLSAAPRIDGVGFSALPSGAVLLQPGGADSMLRDLGELVASPGSTLISHYPDRRAVVRREGPEGRRYVKVVRPARFSRTLRAQAFLSDLPGRGFAVPTLRARDESLGRMTLDELEGASLHQLESADEERFVAACEAVGTALRSLHEAPAPAWTRPHDAADEIGALKERLDGVIAFVPEFGRHAAAVLDGVVRSLGSSASRPCIVHRDFHEKQVFVDPRGGIGLLDFDTLALGEPALDVANMLAHFELAVVQGRCSAAVARRAAMGLLGGYGPDPEWRARLQAYLDSARLRLAMLFALRPRWVASATAMVDLVGRPLEQWLGGPTPAVARGATPPRTLACPFLFVVGCPRSGTTLLERMIGARPDIAMAHETNWITRLCKGRDGLHADSRVTPEVLNRLYGELRFARMGVDRGELEAMLRRGGIRYRAFVTAVYDAFRRAHGRPLAGDKSTGGYLRNLRLLHEICPGARIVHLIRDGRDVWLSMQSWPKAPRAAGRFPLWQVDPVATVAAWWRWHVRHGIEEGRPLGSDAYQEVRYEAVVARPRESCAALCAFLGLPYDDAMPRFADGRTRSAAGLSANAAWLPPTPGLRDWRTQMAAADVELFEAIAGETLAELGYERVFPRVSARVAAIAAERMAAWGAQVGEGRPGSGVADAGSLQETHP